MKTNKFTIIWIAVTAIISVCSAQNQEIPDPYSLFGKTYVLGEERQTADKIFVIRNFPPGSPVDRIEHHTLSGIIKIFGKDGKLVGEKQLADGENAWTTPDPLAEKYYSISPYAYCNNNPLRYVDPNGMEFTESAWKWVNQLISEINSQQEKNSNRIAEKQAKLGNANLSGRKINRLNKQIDRLNDANGNLSATRSEIGVLAASSQVYDVLSDNSMNTTDMMVGGFKFNFSNGNAEIAMPDGGDMGLFSHELKHAYQFETGQLSIGPSMRNDSDGYTNFFYDKNDEVAAYSRGSMFGQTGYTINNLPSIYQNIPIGPVDAVNHPGLANINSLPSGQRAIVYSKIANTTKHAFRIGGQTYYKPR